MPGDTFGTVFRLLILASNLPGFFQLADRDRAATGRELCTFLCNRRREPTQEQLQKMGSHGKTSASFLSRAAAKLPQNRLRWPPRVLRNAQPLPRNCVSHPENPSPREIEKSLSGTRFMRLAETGYELVAQGVTAFDEIEKAVGES